MTFHRDFVFSQHAQQLRTIVLFQFGDFTSRINAGFSDEGVREATRKRLT